jgi:thioester reductase-like protein
MAAIDTQRRQFVLLTGSTGLVGGQVLARLIERDISVAVLVRSNRRQTAAERVEALMLRLEERFGRLFVRPVVLDGDLCKFGLGLSDSDRRWISENCGSVIHSAANLLFRPANEHPDNEPYRTNVDGTLNLLNLTKSVDIKEWHYVSTAYIAGLRNGTIFEHESDIGQEFGNDYERSKSLAENMLRQSSAIESLTIYRPSIVIDLHPTTSMRSDQTINTAFAVFKSMSQRFGLPERGVSFGRLGFRGEERKNIVTVDWVAKMITQIYRRPELHGSTYHLTSPVGTSMSLLEDSFRAAVQNGGVNLPAERPDATALIDEHTAPFVAAFKPYFKDDPKFDRTNTELAMTACGETDISELTVEALRDFCIRQTASTLPAQPTKQKTFAWCRALALLDTVAQMPDAQTLHDLSLVGLTLTGAGGGQWLIKTEVRPLVVQVASASFAKVRWFAATDTMNKLIENQLTVGNVLETGQLMLEFDCPRDTSCQTEYQSEFEKHLHQFTEIIAEIHRMIRLNQDRSTEVIHVG